LVDVVDNLETDERGGLRYHFIIIDFLATLKGGDLKAGSDTIEAQWVPLGEVEEHDLTKTFRETEIHCSVPTLVGKNECGLRSV